MTDPTSAPASLAAPAPRPWTMPALVKITLLLHALALAALAVAPRHWPAILGLVIANHLLLTVTGLCPRSTWLGKNWLLLPPAARARGEVALTIDDGPDAEVTPLVLDLLDRHGAKATFFCVGEQVRRHPALCREILARGHALENHSQHHRHHFSLLGFAAMRNEIGAAQASIEAATGSIPRFFRAPAGLRNPFLDPVLCRLGLQLVSWSRRGFDTRCAEPETVLRRLQRKLAPGAILLLHDRHARRDANGVPVILAVLPRLLQEGRQAGLHFVSLPAAFGLAPNHPPIPQANRP